MEGAGGDVGAGADQWCCRPHQCWVKSERSTVFTVLYVGGQKYQLTFLPPSLRYVCIRLRAWVGCGLLGCRRKTGDRRTGEVVCPHLRYVQRSSNATTPRVGGRAMCFLRTLTPTDARKEHNNTCAAQQVRSCLYHNVHTRSSWGASCLGCSTQLKIAPSLLGRLGGAAASSFSYSAYSALCTAGWCTPPSSSLSLHPAILPSN